MNKLSLAFLSVIFVVFAYSQENLPVSQCMSNYDKKTLRVNYNYVFNEDGKRFFMTGFGISKEFADLLGKSPSAKEDLKNYRKYQKPGMALYWI